MNKISTFRLVLAGLVAWVGSVSAAPAGTQALTQTETVTAIKLLTSDAAASSQALVKQFGAQGAAMWVGGFKVIQGSISKGTITTAQLEAFVNENQLTATEVMAAANEVVLAKKAVSLENLKSTQTLVSFNSRAKQGLTIKAAGTDGVGAKEGVLTLTPAQASDVFKRNSTAFSSNRVKGYMDQISTDASAGAQNGREMIGNLIHAAQATCKSLKGVPDCDKVAMKSLENWIEGVFLFLTNKGVDPTKAYKFALSVYATYLGHPVKESIILGWNQITSDIQRLGANAYIPTRKQVSSCVFEGSENGAVEALVTAGK